MATVFMQIYWNKRKRLHKKRVQLPQDWFVTPTWPPFHCFGTQYGCRDVMWKHAIPVYSVDTPWLKRHVMQIVSRYNSEHDLLWRTCENRTNNNIDWNLQERHWTVWSLFLSIKIWFKSKSPGSEPESVRSALTEIYNRVIPGVI